MNPAIAIALTWIVLPALACALALAGWRALRGPSLADRVVGIELMTTLSVGIVAAVAMRSSQRALLDVGLVVALIGFLSTAGFARYIEQRGKEEHS